MTWLGSGSRAGSHCEEQKQTEVSLWVWEPGRLPTLSQPRSQGERAATQPVFLRQADDGRRGLCFRLLQGEPPCAAGPVSAQALPTALSSCWSGRRQLSRVHFGGRGRIQSIPTLPSSGRLGHCGEGLLLHTAHRTGTNVATPSNLSEKYGFLFPMCHSPVLEMLIPMRKGVAKGQLSCQICVLRHSLP